MDPPLVYKTEYIGDFVIHDGTKYDCYIRMYTASKAEWFSRSCNGNATSRGQAMQGMVFRSPATVSRVGNSNTIVITEKMKVESDYGLEYSEMKGEIQPDGSILGETIQYENGVREPCVGHFNLVPTATAVDVDEDAEIVAKRSLSLAKAAAGVIRLVSEDMYNGACQLIYLCKIWNEDKVGIAIKAFVISSVAAGFACSLLGPIQESINLRKLKAPTLMMTSGNPMSGVQYDQLSDAPKEKNQSSLPLGKIMRTESKSLEEMLFKSNSKKSARLYRTLLAAACSYWVSMVCAYFLVQPTCDGGVPKLAWIIFLIMTMCNTLMQIWVLVQSRNGYLIFKQCQPVVILSILFENLGRYDTFGDVANAVTIRACADADPEFYSWFSIYGYKFNLPTNLGNMVTLGLVFILVMQAVPGLVLLCFKRWYTIALKLNELCIILGAIAREAYQIEEDHDAMFDEDGNFSGDVEFPAPLMQTEMEAGAD